MNSSEIKKKAGKYLFEVIVIFIGITISFLFESWRKNQEGRLETVKQLTLLENDLSRAYTWIEEIDSNYYELTRSIALLKNGQDMDQETFSLLVFKIFDSPVDFPLRDISPYLNQVSRLNSADNIEGSDKILTNVAYIQTLVREDYELNKSISDHVDNALWPKLAKDDFHDKVLNVEKSWVDSTVVWTKQRYSIASFDDLNSDLSFVEFKLRKILIIHDALKRKISVLREDLGKV